MMMQAMLTVARGVQFAAAIVLFGQFAFAYAVSPEHRMPNRFQAVTGWAALALALSAIGWLVLESSSMSGQPIGEALATGTWTVVLTRTFFGHAWIARGALFVVLCVVLAGMRRQHAAGWRVAGAFASLLLLVTLACTGHAAGGVGAERVPHLLADALHLLAAGAWLGALVPLVAFVREAARMPHDSGLALAYRAAERFSMLGIASVGTLVLTGIVNACYTIHAWDDVLGSRYGLELVAKLAIFSVIVLLAAVNRQRVVPRLAQGANGASALRALAHNAWIEVVLGFAIVAIVGNLGITAPAMAGMH